MKHIAIFTLLFAFLLTGCSTQVSDADSGTHTTTQTPTVEDVLDQSTQQKEPSAEVAPPDVPQGFGSFDSVDIDLTTMSSTMVYTQVYTMISNPQEYIGKTVKMHGEFGYYYETSVDTYYFGVVVKDATACCAQGIEFDLTDKAERTFPEDYPEPGSPATVVGVFNTYFPAESPDWEYYHLEQAEFVTE